MKWSHKLCCPLLLLLLSPWIQACAAKSYLEMTYQLPAQSAAQMGRKACLTVTDTRKTPEIFSSSAQKAYKNFSSFFNLTVLSIDEKSAHYGNVELEMLFQRALEERLQNMGVELLSSCSDQYPTLNVAVKTFQIDLIRRKWIANVAYEASLTVDRKKIVKESVAGKAERVKLVGSKAAQTVVEELFNDMINRLDINRLFDQLMS